VLPISQELHLACAVACQSFHAKLQMIFNATLLAGVCCCAVVMHSDLSVMHNRNLQVKGQAAREVAIKAAQAENAAPLTYAAVLARSAAKHIRVGNDTSAEVAAAMQRLVATCATIITSMHEACLQHFQRLQERGGAATTCGIMLVKIWLVHDAVTLRIRSA
jgi:hypothetical protein